MDRVDQIKAWQDWLWGQGIPTFPLYGIMNGQCRCPLGSKCNNAGKHPKIKGWRHLDRPHPTGSLDNLGVSTDSLVVVDIDSGDVVPSDLPETFTVTTGRGLHLWYWANPDHPISNSVGWRPKIDIRSVGGLVAAPPSKHSSGAEYTYVGGEIQPVPSTVVDTQKRFVHREKKDQVTQLASETDELMWPLAEALAEEVENASNGSRNATLFMVLCRYFELAETNSLGEDALRLIFDAGRRNGLPAGEILTTIDSASRSLHK